jgi:purine operon repressor
LELFGLGKVETLAGAAGGVRFIPGHKAEDDNEFLKELAVKLASPDRILAGGMLYVTDILCDPQIVVRLGEVFMSRLQHLAPDYVMTVETRGISLALLVARAFNVPLVMARHDNSIIEGPSVNINYVSGSQKEIRNMSLAKRVMQPGSKVLIVDDVMKAGGTARGMMELVAEVDATVVGKAFLIETAQPENKLVDDYTAFFRLYDVNEETRKITIEPILG